MGMYQYCITVLQKKTTKLKNYSLILLPSLAYEDGLHFAEVFEIHILFSFSL